VVTVSSPPFSNAKDFKDRVLQVTEKNHHQGEFIILDCSGAALGSWYIERSVEHV
jgi:hypothetical protein